MAKRNKYNSGLQYNKKAPQGGSIYNHLVFGIVGEIKAVLTASIIPHMKRRCMAVVGLASGITGTGRRILQGVVNIVSSAIASAKGIRARRVTGSVNAVTASNIFGRLKRRVTSTINAVLELLARLRQKYKPVFPRLWHISYPVEMEYEEYTLEACCVDYKVLLEVIGLAVAGSTVTLRGTFPDSAGNLIELDDVVLKVYAPGRVLVDTITPTLVETGVYSGEFTIPEQEGQFDYEFSGTLGDKTIVGRSSIQSHWRE